MVRMLSEQILSKVHEDYNSISQEFSDSRQADWPVFERFIPYLKPETRVLDLGCGNGRLFSFLKRHDITQYWGVDSSEALIELARQAHPDARFEVAPMQSFTSSEPFDVLIAVASFHHLPPNLHLETLKRWRSLLKPGGVLIMVNWNFYRWSFWRVWLSMVFRRRWGWKGLEIPWKNRVNRYYYAFTLSELSRLLNEAGFFVLETDTDLNFLTIAHT